MATRSPRKRGPDSHSPVMNPPDALVASDVEDRARGHVFKDDLLASMDSSFHLPISSHASPPQDLEEQLENIFENSAATIDNYATRGLQMFGVAFILAGWWLSTHTEIN
mmetsp:Transcript_2990/g.4418  ORF Transcript_2990/g.4418 Transcript_2990/m.4418 type:complete len:109 (+) Transcript_2990:20-346(+)